MKIDLPFDLPFERCKSCLAFDPYVQRSDYKIDEKFEVSCKTEYKCKGEKFCWLREEMRNESNV